MNYYTLEDKMTVFDNTEEKKEKRNKKKKKLVRIILTILLVIFASLGICFLLQALFYDHTTGYTLTNEYVRNYCRRSQCLRQGVFILHLAVLMLIAIIYTRTKIDNDPRNIDPKLFVFLAAIAITGISCLCIYTSDYCTIDQKLYYGILILLVAFEIFGYNLTINQERYVTKSIVMYLIATIIFVLSFTGISAYKTYIVLTNEPTVSISTVADRYTRRSHKSIIRRYYLKFSDGRHCRVLRSEFYQAHVGDEYYIAYYESTIAGWDNTYVYKFDASTYSLPQEQE